MDMPSAVGLQALVGAQRAAVQKSAQDRAALTQYPPTQYLELEGQPCVLKWAQPKPWARVRSGLAALGCWLAFGERVAPAALRSGGGVQLEAQRLRALRMAGRQVPRVLWQDEDCMVLEAVGTSLDRIVPQLVAAEKMALFERVADDLANWHRSGHWHGGAQLRNVTLHGNLLYRIDFEERHGHVLPAPVSCVYDMLLFFGDALARLDAAQVLPQGERLMQRYLDLLPQAQRAAIKKCLKRLLRVLAPLVWLDACWPYLTRRRDKQRVLRFARVAARVLLSSPRNSQFRQGLSRLPEA